jgi:hypothetical protein
MKKINPMIWVFATGLMLNACNGSGKKTVDSTTDSSAKTTTTTETAATSKLEGSWVVKREDGDAASEQVGTVYEFKGSKLTTGKDGFNIPGTTEVTDKTFSFLADGGKDKVMYNYNFDGDTLVISMQDGPQVFHLLKK